MQADHPQATRQGWVACLALARASVTASGASPCRWPVERGGARLLPLAARRPLPLWGV